MSSSAAIYPQNKRADQATVLVINRNWQAIHVKTPAEGFCMMASGAARGLDMQGDDAIVPVTWDRGRSKD